MTLAEEERKGDAGVPLEPEPDRWGFRLLRCARDTGRPPGRADQEGGALEQRQARPIPKSEGWLSLRMVGAGDYCYERHP